MGNWTSIEVELLRFFGQAVVVIVGWAVVHWLSGRRARQEAQRKLLIEECGVLIAAVEKNFFEAFAYHTEMRISSRESKLNLALTDITERVGLIMQITNANSVRSLASKVIELKQSCTLSHFEDEHSDAISSTDPIIRNLERSSIEMRHALAKLRYDLLSTSGG
jgi:hypothetical protein